MADFHDLLDRRAVGYGPPSDLFERVLDRRRRRNRNRRVGSAIVALVVAVVVIGGLLRAFAAGTIPADDPRSPYLGAWHSTDADGSPQTMTVGGDGAGVAIELHDISATVCPGAVPSTTTGTGQIGDTGELVIPSPALTCDDGSVSVYLSSVEEQMRDLTFVYDRDADTLTDSFAAVWAREGEAVPDPTSEVVPAWPRGWPDTNRNRAGEYSWDPAHDPADREDFRCGSSISRSSCAAGFMHNGYGSGDVEIRIEQVPGGGMTGATAVTVAGHDGIYRRIDPRREWWIVDIEGTTIAIRLEARPRTSEADLAEAHAIIGSIRAEPQDNDIGFRLVFTLTTDDWDSG